MIDRLVSATRTWVFLRRKGVVFGSGVSLEGHRRLLLGKRVTLGDRVRIRSRRDGARVSIGDSVRLREEVEINAKALPVTLGHDCFVAKGVWIGGCGEIAIGSNTMIGIRSILVSSDHDYLDVSVPYYDVSEVPKPIEIGDNVWIGCNCVILGGSRIGSGSVVAAGAVVAGEFSDNSLLAGVPAALKRTIER